MIFLYAVLFLFFFQLISDFIEAIYAFGLMGTSIPPEIASVLLLFSPLLLLIPRRAIGRSGLILLIILTLAARLAYPLFDTRGKLLIAGLGVAAFLLWLAANLSNTSRKGESQIASQMGNGLALAVIASILLRAAGAGVDLSTSTMTQVIAWLLALLALTQLPNVKGEQAGNAAHAPFGKVAALSLGVMAAFTLCYFAFSAPNVIARWTGVDILPIIALLLAALLSVIWITGRATFWNWLSLAKIVAWNVAFLVALLLTILLHQIHFPSDPTAYPLYQSANSVLSFLPLVAMLLLSPVVLVDFRLFIQALLALHLSPRRLGGAFSLAALFLAVSIFAQVFTTVYDYIPVVGPFFRDKFWLVFLVVGLALALPLPLLRQPATAPIARQNILQGAYLVLGIAALGAAMITQPGPPVPVETSTIRVLTYNIQQGYRADGQKDLAAQLAVMQEWDADVIGLQESDSNRIAGGNADLVGYYASRLNMYSYYGPTTVTGTFGIALLSRYPIREPQTFFMYSVGEQTATLRAKIQVNEHWFNLFVTHLGNDGPIIQQQAVLQEADGLDNLIMMGDFNFEPGGAQYALTRQSLADAWLLRWKSGVDDQGVNPSDRIDHIFVSPGMQILDARYIYSPASDHPALGVEMGW